MDLESQLRFSHSKDFRVGPIGLYSNKFTDFDLKKLGLILVPGKSKNLKNLKF